jgi:hypothetical protein
MGYLKLVGALCAAMAFTSCATIIRGAHDELKVISTPSGADVALSSGERGVTPVAFVKRRRDNFQVTISKPGYISQTVRVESRASGSGAAATAGNLALGGIGVAVDAGTGAWNSLYPNPVSVQLVPLPIEPQRRGKKGLRGGYPVATPSGQPGMVRSPYTRRLYDVRAVPHQALVRDVDVDKLFLNP